MLVLLGMALILYPYITIKPRQGLQIFYRTVNSHQDIMQVNGPEVMPVTYTNVISFKNLDVTLKKKNSLIFSCPLFLSVNIDYNNNV